MKTKITFSPGNCKALFLILIAILSYTNAKGQDCSVNANVDQSICATDVLTLIGTKGGLIPGATLWSQVSGPSVIIVNPTSLTTAVTGITGGNTYRFRLSTTCLDESLAIDEVTYTVKPVTPANAGSDQASCPGANVITLSGNSLVGGETGLWSVVGSNNGVTINSASSPTSTVNLSPGSAGNTTLRWTVTNPSGCFAFDDVLITGYGGVSPVNAGADIFVSRCYSTTTFTSMAATFGGNGTGSQMGVWTIISGPNIPVISNPVSNSTIVSNLIEGTYTLRWTVTGPCDNGSDDVQIIVPAPVGSNTAASTSSTQTYCDARSTVTLTANSPVYANEVGVWTFLGGPTVASIASPNNQITTVTNLGTVGTYSFRWTITNSLTA